jgi:hypothetical protein
MDIFNIDQMLFFADERTNDLLIFYPAVLIK